MNLRDGIVIHSQYLTRGQTFQEEFPDIFSKHINPDTLYESFLLTHAHSHA